MGLPSLSPPAAFVRHNVWRGDEFGMADAPVVSTGHAVLDAQLPGGGWPVGAMTEVLQSSPEAHVWQLLLPALAAAVKVRGGRVVLVGAPHAPFGPALAAAGLPVEALLWIRSETSVARCWACEQALRCADVAAVLGWLPQARAGDLRRLQLSAAPHESLLFVFRPASAAQSASPARLRLRVTTSADAQHAGQASQAGHDGQIDVRLLKRRGPPLGSSLMLPARSERLAVVLAASLRRHDRRQRQNGAFPATTAIAAVVRLDPRNRNRTRKERASDAMARVAVAA